MRVPGTVVVRTTAEFRSWMISAPAQRVWCRQMEPEPPRQTSLKSQMCTGTLGTYVENESVRRAAGPVRGWLGRARFVRKSVGKSRNVGS